MELHISFDKRIIFSIFHWFGGGSRDFFFKIENSHFIDRSYDVNRFFLINNNGYIETCVACHFHNPPYMKRNYSWKLICKFYLQIDTATLIYALAYLRLPSEPTEPTNSKYKKKIAIPTKSNILNSLLFNYCHHGIIIIQNNSQPSWY